MARSISPRKKSTTERETRKRNESSPTKKNTEVDYEIDKIVDHQLYNEFYVKYKVVWKGWPISEASWLTEKDLCDATDVLDDYKFSVTGKNHNEDGDFVVQEILAHRDEGDKRLYLVHWKDWDSPVSHSELEEHQFTQAKDILKKYINGLKSTKKSVKAKEETNKVFTKKTIVEHNVYNTHYVKYKVVPPGCRVSEGLWLTEYDLRDDEKLLEQYKYKVTGQKAKSGDVYEVEEILAHRNDGRKRYYLVHWKGWDNPVSHSEQETSELKDAKHILNEYEESLKKGKGGGTKMPRKRSGSNQNVATRGSKRFHKEVDI